MEDIIKSLEKLKNLYWGDKIGVFRGHNLASSQIYNKKINISMWEGVYPDRKHTTLQVSLEEITSEEKALFENYIESRMPNHLKVTRERYLINFENLKTGETMTCNLKDKKFTKTYVGGKQRDVKYPHSFFSGIKGQLVTEIIPQDDNFAKLMEVIVKKEYKCSSFGTFLVRMFDNFHLETYISVGAKFSSHIKVPLNYFDKDVRKILESKDMEYNQMTQKFFMNKDIGRSLFSIIKDREDFKEIFKYLADKMVYIVRMVENHNYNVQSLFNYMLKRDFKSGAYAVHASASKYGYYCDMPQYMDDYARMASAVYSSDFVQRTEEIESEDVLGTNDFPKYPKDMKRAHDYVAVLYASIKDKIDEIEFKKLIQPKYEYQKGEFCIVNPESSLSVRLEGNALGHCVGGYVQQIIRGETYIVFLRDKKQKQIPLVTVEIRDGKINQVRGKCNRRPNYDENVFLGEFAKAKGLTYKVSAY